jgi:hypothetical protein
MRLAHSFFCTPADRRLQIWRFKVSEEKVEQVVFTSGEIIPVSGIWLSSHEGCEAAYELWLGKENCFPPCLACRAAASYTLVEEVQHISEDPDFQ